MANRLDFLFQEWHRLGGAVLLAEIDPNISARQPEDVIAEKIAELSAVAGQHVMTISGVAGMGVEQALRRLSEAVADYRAGEKEAEAVNE